MINKPETKAAPLPPPVEGWYSDPKPGDETLLPRHTPHHGFSGTPAVQYGRARM